MGATRLASGKYYAFYTLHFAMHVLPVKTVIPPGHHSYEGADFAIRATEIPLPHYPHNIPHKHIYTTLLTVQTNAGKRADKCRQPCRQNQPLSTHPNHMIFMHLKAKVQSADKMSSKCRCARVRVCEETILMQYLTTTYTNFVLYVL